VTLHRRLAAASGLVSIALLAGGANAALAFAHPHSGSGDSGSGSSNHDDSASSTNDSSTTGDSTSSSTGSPNPLASISGHIRHSTKRVTGAITDGLPDSNTPHGTKSKDSKDRHSGAAKDTPTKSSPATSDASSSAAATTAPTTTDATNVTKQASPTTVSLPVLAARLPLIALDLIKTEIPVIAAAIPLAGMSALPAIADALITPLQEAVSGLATVASGLPFMEVDLGPTVAAPSQMSSNHYQRSVPSVGAELKSAGPDPQTGGNGAADAPAQPPQSPENPAKPTQIFSASSHFTTQPDFRPGYPDYLRAAGLSEVAAVAVPGFAGILTITCAGGLLGYRQARASRATAPGRAARFVN
jgi:hypothetical protein